MRRIAILAGSAAALGLILPAAAQASYGYADHRYNTHRSNNVCDEVRSDRQAAGAVIGGLLGAALGNGVAASKNREEGTALGAVLGAAVGAGIGNDSADCAPRFASRHHGHQGWYPASEGLYGGPGDYRAPRHTHPDYRYGQRGYQDYGRPDYGYGPQGIYREDPRAYRPYGHTAPPAARQCETAWQTITLPDGRELREPVRVCREATYGGWEVQGGR